MFGLDRDAYPGDWIVDAAVSAAQSVNRWVIEWHGLVTLVVVAMIFTLIYKFLSTAHADRGQSSEQPPKLRVIDTPGRDRRNATK